MFLRQFVMNRWVSALVCASLATLLTTTSARALTFKDPVSYPTAAGAKAVTAGDFNGDGKLDLAVARYSNISVFLGNGDGTFATRVDYPAAAQNFVSIVAADFDGDGKLDLAAAGYSNADSIVVIWGNGNGTFQTPVYFVSGDYPESVRSSDFNGDGIADLAVANHFGNSVTVFTGNSARTLDQRGTYGVGTYPASLAIRDINGDGKQDLVVTNFYSGDLSLLTGNGDGTFSGLSTLIVTSPTKYPQASAVADFTGDGKPDIMTLTDYYPSNGRAYLLRGDGAGNFSTYSWENFGVGLSPKDIIAADVNHDGKPDLLVANRNGDNVTLRLNAGNGSFKEMVTLPAGDEPLSVFAADFNGDDALDFVVANNTSSTVSVYLNDPTIFPVGTTTPSSHDFGLVYIGFPASQELTISNSGNGPLTIDSRSFPGADFDKFSVTSGGTSPCGAVPFTVAPGGSCTLVVTCAPSAPGALSTQLVATQSDPAYPNLVVPISATALYPSYSLSLLPEGSGTGTIQFSTGENCSGGCTFSYLVNTQVNLTPQPANGSYFAGWIGCDSVTGTTCQVTMTRAKSVTAFFVAGEFNPIQLKANAPLKSPTWASPFAITTAEFNGDGILDLAYVSNSGSSLAIMLGNGDGTFTMTMGGAAGATPMAVAAGDLNGDGLIDLVTANHDGSSISRYLGNGDGTFLSLSELTLPYNPNAAIVGDLTGDGIPDLAVACFHSSSLLVYRGLGDASFTTAPISSHALVSPMEIAKADFNNDGKLDIAVAQFSNGTVAILMGNGNGFFTAYASLTVGSVVSHVATADVNRDGKIDLITDDASNGSVVAIFLGNGNGTFQPKVTYDTPLYAPFALGDTNGDGFTDLIGAHNTNAIAVTLGNGTEQFGTVRNGGSISYERTISGDFNGDGRKDLAAIASYPEQLVILLAQSDGTFTRGADYATGQSPGSPLAADLNNDGRLDLAIAHGSGTVGIFIGNGNGTFQPQQEFTVGGNPRAIVAVDLNNDGKIDLASINANATMSILLGNGDGTFQPKLDTTLGGDPLTIATNDFNRDGKADLVVGRQNRPLAVYLGNGNGTFQPRIETALGDWAYPQPLGTGDFNGDAIPDVVFGDSWYLTVMLGVGDGTFNSQTRYLIDGFSSNLAIGDFNGDGATDLATHNGTAILLMLGNGNGSFQEPATFATVSGTSSFSAGDFNGDGKTDFAVGNMSLSLLLNTSFSGLPIQLGGETPIYFVKLQSAYASVPDGGVMKLSAVTFSESLTLSRDITVSLLGGYDAGYSQPVGTTIIRGQLVIDSGTLIIDNVAIV